MQRMRAVTNSALWAAAGDALGWITELARGPSGVEYRVGVAEVREPVKWQRIVGGRGGVRADLEAGTYSDDTQLRLAVGRSIRGDGSFDVETFAKIEVTVWPTYALGGGLGTKAAAANLSKRTVNWFSNFFDISDQRYVNGGGNGAAMRIQPHVWASATGADDMLLNVLRDALVTHGHAHGFFGAFFHALCLNHVVRFNEAPSPSHWHDFIRRFSEVPRLVSLEPHLAAFWQPTWENNAGTSLADAVKNLQREAYEDLKTVEQSLKEESSGAYHSILEGLGCLSPQFRGSGFKTALAAAALSHMHVLETPAIAIVKAANELESDTDTIATMVGAILGAAADHEPNWAIQDRSYIVEEAQRLARISLGEPQDNFTYPDLGRWNPPAKQNASVGWCGTQLAIAGLGLLTARGVEYQSGDAIWQWFSLPFGQSILAKRRADGESNLAPSQLPGPRQPAKTPAVEKQTADLTMQSSLPLISAEEKQVSTQEREDHYARQTRGEGIDAWTDMVIQSDFDNLTLGRLLNRCIDRSDSIDAAIAFVGIIAKAKVARRKRRRS